jgi:hypothetical protein
MEIPRAKLENKFQAQLAPAATKSFDQIKRLPCLSLLQWSETFIYRRVAPLLKLLFAPDYMCV